MHEEDYKNYGIIDFINDDVFLKHYLCPSDSSNTFWSNWLEQNPHKKEEWTQASQLLETVMLGLNDYANTYLSEENQIQLLERIHRTNALLENEAQVVLLWRKKRVMTAVAAAFLLLIVCVWQFDSLTTTPSVYEQKTTDLGLKGNEKVNDTDKSMAFTLPDSSVITLSPKSKLSYAADFGQKTRTVYLSGEAKFEVAKNLKKPFYVYANEVVTKVLGTSFVINAFDKNKDITVMVQTGQVSVYRPNKPETSLANKQKTEGVLLLPNQQVVFEREKEQFIKSLVANPVILKTPEQEAISFEFDETPITKTFEYLEKAYGVDIIYNAETLKDCQITASLTQETLFQKLTIITQIIDGTYETVDGQIVITAKGCQ